MHRPDLPIASVPYADIDLLSLDVGNTLISVDFDYLARRLAEHGVRCGAEQLRRAEAAARPHLSRRFAAPAAPGAPEPFLVYLHGMLSCLDPATLGCDGDLAGLVARAAPGIRGDRASSLWRTVMPRVADALDAFRRLDLRLVVISNSDGTVEQALIDAGLRPFFTEVLDSAVVGFEKPDPRIFLEAVRRCGADANRTLHVGDMYDVDVLGARRAGLHAVLLDPFDDWTVQDCDRVADLWALAERLAASRQ
jgi:putative hydrolase of the HAD superfamily